MAKIALLRTAGIILVFCTGAAIAVFAQAFTNVFSFEYSGGFGPYAGLIQAIDTNFYGTTFAGGAGGYGTVFKITPAGALTNLYNFCAQTGCSDGANPYAGLIQATDGNFYGTTEGGGSSNCQFFAHGCGTVFKITAAAL
jgi:uncharacterized repeat protein (TIGR03803 family)